MKTSAELLKVCINNAQILFLQLICQIFIVYPASKRHLATGSGARGIRRDAQLAVQCPQLQLSCKQRAPNTEDQRKKVLSVIADFYDDW